MTVQVQIGFRDMLQRASADQRFKLALMVPLLLAAKAPPTVSYTVLSGGNPIGSMKVERTASRETTDFKYLDRGQGPDLRQRVALDAKGVPVDARSTGLNTQRRSINDRFWRDSSRWRWKTDIDFGSSVARGFYLPVEHSPADFAGLARALLRSGGTLRVLPTGEAKLRRVQSTKVGENVATLYMIDGIDWAPVPLWLDSRHDLFMYNFSRGYLTTIRKGYERYESELVAAQTAASVEYEQAIAQRLSRPRGTVLIRGASVFDAENKRVLDDRAVLIRGNRIAWTGPSAQAPVVPEAETIDAAGKFLLPGLFDMHTHLYSDYFGRLLLANGVTSVRDLGATPIERIIARRDAYASGRMLGPRITMSGFMDGAGPHAGPTDAIVKTADQVKSWVDRYAKDGVGYIKIYSSMDHALVPVAIAAARSRGLRVGGHVPFGMKIDDVIKLGFDEVQHAGYWLDYLMPPEVETGDANADWEAHERLMASLDSNSAEADRLIGLLADRKTVVDPTIVTFEDIYRDGRGQLSNSLHPVAEKLPAMVRRKSLAGGSAISSQMADNLEKQIQLMLRILKRLHDAGITIVPGSDTLVRGFPYIRELELYEKAGIPRPDILQMATLGSAKIVNQDRELGSIASGKLADLVLIDGDPTRSIAALRNPVLVVKDGIALDPQRLLKP